jgi:hypothetical protein
MINKVIIFGDFSSRDFEDINHSDYIYFKSAAVLRTSYYLRKENFIVKQVHHCNMFNKDELEKILNDFSNGDPILICVSTSFLPNSIRTYDSVLDKIGYMWGKSFNFLCNIAMLAKKYNFPIILGGFEMLKFKFQNAHLRKAWGFDILDAIGINYYIYGNDISIIKSICNNDQISFEKIQSSKFVTVPNMVDFSDCASTPLSEDHILSFESLITEVAAGCIFSCSYCTYSALGKRKEEFVRTYESLKQEVISNYNNFGTRVYMMSDNMLNDYETKLHYLKNIREETGINLRWIGYARLDVIKTKKQAQLLYDSGAAALIFGIESFKKEVGPYLGKLCNKEKLIESLELVREVGGDDIILSAAFISGIPTETKEELLQTYDWLISNRGRHLLDQYRFITLFVNPEDQDNKNEINKGRNSPYKDYTFKSDVDRISGEFWTSPWGTYSEFFALSKKLNVGQGTAFSIPFIHNCAIQMGIDIEELIKIIRFQQYDQYTTQLKNINSKLLNDYKNKVLSR